MYYFSVIITKREDINIQWEYDNVNLIEPTQSGKIRIVGWQLAPDNKAEKFVRLIDPEVFYIETIFDMHVIR